ncbi:MAG: helix-turn-helix domain-containing protein [Bacteroidota bacterium]|nr:helix-turn-helix domain-containing protein [Bacteroidota bacterium]
MKFIFLIAAFNALFFSVLLFQKKPKAVHDKILIFWLVYLGLYTGVYGLFSNELFTHFPLLSAGFISLILLHGPFLYVYISSLVINPNKFKSKNLIHFVPFLLFNLYLSVASFFPGISERISLSHAASEHESPVLFQLFLILIVLSGPAYFVLSTRLFKKLDIQIFNNFSSAENLNLDWLRKLVYIFGSVWTLLMVVAVIHHVFQLFSWVFCTDGISLSLSIFIILIGYYGLKQKELFSFPEKESFVLEQKSEKYAGSGLKESEALLYLEKLNNFMAAEKPYLNPKLTLPQLAKEVDIPSHYLSQVINENLELNFFDFINRQRVEDVKSKISGSQYQNYSILGIAFESGFNSKSAFNRVFKNITGLTPSEYKKSLSV